MACPYSQTSADYVGANTEESQTGINNVKRGGFTYGEYLQIDKLLSCQKMASENNPDESQSVHDEHLFIITHQTYELWFKQILFEIDSIRDLFTTPLLDESKTLLIIRRLNRIVVILKLLVDQFAIMETMAPHDFMDFRDYLAPASGFQSIQFRLLENKLGIKPDNRVKYNQMHYKEVFHEERAVDEIEKSMNEPSLLELVEKWLTRTPGLDPDFNFWERYKAAALNWIEEHFHKSALVEEDPTEKKIKMADFQKQKDTYDSIATADLYNASLARGERRLNYEAFQGALLISLYRNEPRFHQPFQVLTLLMDIDSLLIKWRHNHVMMVQRMIGSKVGTGGSSGYLYLRSTVSDRYKIFLDLFNLSTYMIPRKVLPPLNAKMKRRLSTLENIVENMNGLELHERCQDSYALPNSKERELLSPEAEEHSGWY